jgi:hypothetical protein
LIHPKIAVSPERHISAERVNDLVKVISRLTGVGDWRPENHRD